MAAVGEGVMPMEMSEMSDMSDVFGQAEPDRDEGENHAEKEAGQKDHFHTNECRAKLPGRR